MHQWLSHESNQTLALCGASIDSRVRFWVMVVEEGATPEGHARAMFSGEVFADFMLIDHVNVRAGSFDVGAFSYVSAGMSLEQCIEHLEEV